MPEAAVMYAIGLALVAVAVGLTTWRY